MRGRRPESPEPEAAKMSEAPSGPLLPTQTLGRQEEHPHRDSRPPVSSPRDRKETLLRCPAVHTHPREHPSPSATSSPVSPPGLCVHRPHVLMRLPRAPGPHSSPQAVLLLIKIRDPFPFSGSPSIHTQHHVHRHGQHLSMLPSLPGSKGKLPSLAPGAHHSPGLWLSQSTS